MVIDTSILAAIFFLEPERPAYLDKMKSAPRLLLSAAGLVEISIVLLRQSQAELEQALDGFLLRAGIVIVPVDEAQAMIAREAFRRFGRGSRHPANLNYGDCFSYALAAKTRDALLFKGDDFNHTDVLAA
jgi:ribonuclease VapC